MIVETAFTVSPAVIANVFGLAVSSSCKHFLDYVVAHQMQTKAGEGEKAWESVNVLAGSFLFRVKLIGDVKAKGIVHHISERDVAKALAKLSAIYQDEFARIVSGKPSKADACLFLQLCIFPVPRFILEVPKAPRKPRAAKPAPVIAAPVKADKAPAKPRPARKAKAPSAQAALAL